MHSQEQTLLPHEPWALWRLRLQLLRPANLPTAAADVLAGYAVAGLPAGARVGWLIASGVLLYAGGVVLNDFFDAEQDRIERPERPIPRGAVAPGAAFLTGACLLFAAMGAAFVAGPVSGMIATAIAYWVVVYNRWAKHTASWGPLAMGLCRGLNLCLGLSVAPLFLAQFWYLALIPVLYIAAVTLTSTGEVHGGTRASAWYALGAVGMAIVLAGVSGLLPGASWRPAWPFVILLACAVLPAYVRAALHPEPAVLRRAVRAGVLAIVLVDAVLAAGFGGWLIGGLVASLYVVSLGMAKIFAVT